MSTGEPSGSSHGQPLNCQAGPCTNTATTRSLWEERLAGFNAGKKNGGILPVWSELDINAHQSCGASFSGWSMTRYGTVTLSVVPPGWIWSLRLWSRTSLSRGMPCFFLSSEVTNLDRRAHRISRMLVEGDHGKHRGFCSYFRSCRRSLAFSIVMSEVVAAGMMMMGVLEPLTQTRLSIWKEQPKQHLNEGREVPFF